MLISYGEWLRASQFARLLAAGQQRDERADCLATAPPEEGGAEWDGELWPEEGGGTEWAPAGDAAGQPPVVNEDAGDFWLPQGPEEMPPEGWPWPEEEPAKPCGPKGRGGRRRAKKRRGAAARKHPAAPPQGGPRPTGWTDGDVVECRGCWYWRTLDYTLGLEACWYPLLEDRLRPCRPADCYRRPGTPYRPCGPEGQPAGAGQKAEPAKPGPGDPAGPAIPAQPAQQGQAQLPAQKTAGAKTQLHKKEGDQHEH